VLTQHKFHYGWVVVGVTFLTLLIGAGVRSAPGVLLVPLETEFAWSRGTISFAIAVSLLLYGFAGPFSASFMERFGIRRTMLAALSLLAAGVALTTLMRESWQLIVLWGLVVGAGAGVIANVLGAVVAARWFTARRGLVVGLLTGSAAAGQLIFLPTFAAINEHYGWRAMVLTVTAVVSDPWLWDTSLGQIGYLQFANYFSTGGVRTNNTIGYKSPNLSGLTVQARLELTDC